MVCRLKLPASISFGLRGGRCPPPRLNRAVCIVRRLYTKEYTTFAFSGFIRKKVRCATGLSDVSELVVARFTTSV